MCDVKYKKFNIVKYIFFKIFIFVLIFWLKNKLILFLFYIIEKKKLIYYIYIKIMENNRNVFFYIKCDIVLLINIFFIWIFVSYSVISIVLVI